MNYKDIVAKPSPNNPILTEERLAAIEINGKMKHLYNISHKNMTDEEYEKDYKRCWNLCPVKWNSWTTKTQPHDDIILNVETSFSSDDLDKPDSKELDELDQLIDPDEDYSDDFVFSSEE